ncbi:hypothetical protein F5Y10DRAFT_1492 [Nemania abortiva]|nr:hypothetical protein F5Y10DRAFT_1492 [Nemania abortiva]
MAADGQRTQAQGGGTWTARYAGCKDIWGLRSSNENKRPSLAVDAQDRDNMNSMKKRKLDQTNLPGVDATSEDCRPPTQSTHTDSLTLPLVDSSKALQAGIEPSTMDLAASVVLQVANESGYQWFQKWVPHMDLRGVFESISVESKEGELASVQYKVPPDAIDTQNMRTTPAKTLADLYRECRDVHPKGSGDIGFPKLLRLIERCIIFVGALKDGKRKALLQWARSTFQEIPIALDAEKSRILNKAKDDVKVLSRQISATAVKSEGEYRDLKHEWKARENAILDAATVALDTRRRSLELQMLKQLKLLLASTARSPPKSSPLETE